MTDEFQGSPSLVEASLEQLFDELGNRLDVFVLYGYTLRFKPIERNTSFVRYKGSASQLTHSAGYLCGAMQMIKHREGHGRDEEKANDEKQGGRPGSD
jgi:hypothetical protein